MKFTVEEKLQIELKTKKCVEHVVDITQNILKSANAKTHSMTRNDFREINKIILSFGQLASKVLDNLDKINDAIKIMLDN